MVATAAAALSLVAFGFDASAQKQTTSSASRTTTSSTTTTSAATTPSRQTTTASTSSSTVSRQTSSSATTSSSSASRVTTPAASTSSKSTSTSAKSTTSAASSSSTGQTVRRTGDGTGSTTASRQTTSSSTSTSGVSRQTTSNTSTSGVSRQTTTSAGNAAASSKQTTSAKAEEQTVSGRSSTGGTTSSGTHNAEVIVKTTTSARTNTNLTGAGLSTKVQEPEKASGRPLDGSYGSTPSRVEPYRDRGGNYRYDDREFRIDDHNIRRVPPREREFMSYDRPGGFFYDKPHYYGYRVNYLPPRYRRVTYWGIDYYLYDGIYYRLHGSTYYVCRPPAGILVTRALDRALLNLVTFAYFHNVHRSYSTVFDNYARIAEQNRIIAENNARIARQYSNYALNSNRALSAYEIAERLGLVQSYAYANSDYYYQDGVFYLFSASGQYTVIIPPAGALVTSLPEDYETIVLDGIEYYVVDNTVYRTTIFDCQPYLEVLGQMYGSMATKYSYYR